MQYYEVSVLESSFELTGWAQGRSRPRAAEMQPRRPTTFARGSGGPPKPCAKAEDTKTSREEFTGGLLRRVLRVFVAKDVAMTRASRTN
jgi:hypothetical protein